jgi:hypothetical protein
VFDRLCKQFGIDHRLIPPRHPQTNGMVERFNGRISDIVNQTRFGSTAELESTLRNYVKIYNHNIPQRALNHQTPIQALKECQEKQPTLFVTRVYNQAGLDTYGPNNRVDINLSRNLRPKMIYPASDAGRCSVRGNQGAAKRGVSVNNELNAASLRSARARGSSTYVSEPARSGHVGRPISSAYRHNHYHLNDIVVVLVTIPTGYGFALLW